MSICPKYTAHHTSQLCCPAPLRARPEYIAWPWPPPSHSHPPVQAQEWILLVSTWQLCLNLSALASPWEAHRRWPPRARGIIELLRSSRSRTVQNQAKAGTPCRPLPSVGQDGLCLARGLMSDRTLCPSVTTLGKSPPSTYLPGPGQRLWQV